MDATCLGLHMIAEIPNQKIVFQGETEEPGSQSPLKAHAVTSSMSGCYLPGLERLFCWTIVYSITATAMKVMS